MRPSDFLLQAINIIGSREATCILLGISKQRLNSWLNGEVAIGFDCALLLEYFTCGRVTIHDLAPKKAKPFKKLNIRLNNLLPWMTRQLVPIPNIQIPEHLNKRLDDIESLAEDIKRQGLLHPIAMDFKHNLIFGERRLQACKLLKMTSISAWVLSLEALLKDEEAGYHLKRYFFLSERVAIGFALEIILGNRQGQRTDLQLLQNFAEVPKKTTTREKVAMCIGFNNAETYRQAKKIIQTDIRPLIQALDEERISISSAFELTTLPNEERQQILLGDYPFIAEQIQKLKNTKHSIH